MLVPHLDGERTPNRPDATGMLTGLRTDVTPAQLARAAVEGVVCNLLEGADALGGRATEGRVFLVGGAARSAAYRRVVADLTGRPVLVPADDELVAAGAAVQAAARPPRLRLRAGRRGLGARAWATRPSNLTTRSTARPIAGGGVR